MCGFVGYVGLAGEEVAGQPVDQALHTLSHRGPDDRGIWTDLEAGVALGHCRLSVLELSPLGHQPMVSGCGRLVLVYNGEIYNYQDLKGQLESEGHCFKGHSDTEVLLTALASWGVEESCRKANGMFAFAVWDRHDRSLTLARDRFGQKPLYYGLVQDRVVFGSELKGILPLLPRMPDVDRDSMTLFLRHGYVPGPRSIYCGISKLPPGTFLKVGRGTRGADPVAYWSALDAARAGLANPFEGSPAEALEQMEILLRDAVARCMVSDVSIGAFLSGGVDSSTVAALMQAQSSRPVRTFSIGFADKAFDESKFAAAVARHLGTDHLELTVTEADALNVIPDLPGMFDEPFADSSQIPTHLLSKLTREHVTVALSGDGGDEIFCGYNRYLWGKRLNAMLQVAPSTLRRLGCGLLTSIPVAAWDAGASILTRGRVVHAGDKLHKLAMIAAAPGSEAAYLGLTSLWMEPSRLSGREEPASAVSAASRALGPASFIERMMIADTVTYLPDDILVKVDRASMASSLESRIPLLDHRLFEFAWKLPEHMKLQGSTGKLPLRQVLYKYVPRSLIERPKMGFGVPIGPWLRGPLRPWAEEILSERSLREAGLVDPSPVRKAWAEHISGARNWHHQLWVVLMLHAWRQHWASQQARTW